MSFWGPKVTKYGPKVFFKEIDRGKQNFKYANLPQGQNAPKNSCKKKSKSQKIGFWPYLFLGYCYKGTDKLPDFEISVKLLMFGIHTDLFEDKNVGPF
jgi:hypothetical protein